MIDRRLQVLRMVRQHGTVTAAAHALHLTPSAVSQQLRGLARDLDVELLQPIGRRVRLTPAAEVVLEHADRLHAQWEQARADLDAHRRGDVARLRLSAFPSALVALLGPTVELLFVDPRVHLDVVQADPAEALDLLVADEVDLAVLEASTTTPATTDERFVVELLFVDPLQLVVPVDHPLAARDRVSLADAADEPWIAGPEGGSYHQIMVQACARAGFVPAFRHRALDWSAYLAVVGAGLGVALVPRLAVPRDGSVRALSLVDDPPPSRRVLTCVRRGSEHQPAIRRLRDALLAGASPYRDE